MELLFLVVNSKKKVPSKYVLWLYLTKTEDKKEENKSK